MIIIFYLFQYRYIYFNHTMSSIFYCYKRIALQILLYQKIVFIILKNKIHFYLVAFLENFKFFSLKDHDILLS